ncbi:hypothetical protein [Bradyrhizobium elkanii]|uniref:Uncharacterized protein n=1 Tax=Bradyrhizobium elkanii TaxID=29448 RepID=A0A8I1YFB8_BRAEL|nr:hypothetical protein [Bradyrhizobium elkanii]MBP1297569.1 hypothetical protein [Bradyrhizobium elkanii]MCS3577667.1 hypothetical protein [Bradyrhizobium elkanii]MCS3720542.1 hypothetical protein [Bradyrhizobium elkanii]MCS4004959.1 hypothetical protein [Bradyrhizobium elkanii USDA 61]BBC00116.1 hypothetical protein BE61_55700 [Bradyrhizobium elkanii USDA 61]
MARQANRTNAEFAKMIYYLRDSMLGFSSSEITTVPLPARTKASDPFEGFDLYAQPNWDGFDALPVLPETVATAKDLYRFIEPELRDLKRPNIAPGSDGTIGFEWHYRGAEIKKLFIEVQPGRQVRAYWVRSNGVIERLPRGDLANALPGLQRILSILAHGA